MLRNHTSIADITQLLPTTSESGMNKPRFGTCEFQGHALHLDFPRLVTDLTQTPQWLLCYKCPPVHEAKSAKPSECAKIGLREEVQYRAMPRKCLAV